MTTRILPTTVAGRSSSMRRQRRRAAAANDYCRTNGCTTFLTRDASTGRLRCPVCGYIASPA